MLTPYQKYGLQIFSPILKVVFHSVDCVLWCTDVWLFNFHMLFFVFAFCAFSRNLCQSQCHEAFCLCFLLRVTLLGFMFMFRSLIHFKLFFVYGKGLISFFYMWKCSFHNIIYWKDCSFPIKWYWHHWWKSFDHISRVSL